jgi:NAD+-dependent secondary alcohol dehydrogenase Adh1
MKMMKAARLHQFDESLTNRELLVIESVPAPEIKEADDVIVRLGGAGLCRTDLHIVEGIWRTKVDRPLPYTPGHENAGWVVEVGSGVKHFKPGDAVIMHPHLTDGICLACRRGEDMHCLHAQFPGISHDGGFAELMLSKERSLIKLDPTLKPHEVAPYADAGLTAYRAARKAAEILKPGMTVGVIGVGGLGHIAVQVLKSLCAATIIAIDKSDLALGLAEELQVDHCVHADANVVDNVRALTGGIGLEAVIDFVGEHGTPDQAMAMLRKGGTYYIVGYGGIVKIPTIDMIFSEYNIVGNLVGNYAELSELMTLAAQGKSRLETVTYTLDQINEAMHDLIGGRIKGRAVLVP